MYICIELVCTATTYLKQSNMDQPRKVAKPARGQLNREIKCLCRCIRGKYIYLHCCLHLFVYVPGIFFIWGHVHSCTVHCCMCICVTTAVCIYVDMYGNHICSSKGKNRPGKVANPARGHLAEQRKNNYSLSPFAPENVVSRDGFGNPIPRKPAHLHVWSSHYNRVWINRVRLPILLVVS